MDITSRKERIIGDNCSLGSNNIIRNTLMKNNIKILDNCVISKHGFGFFQLNNNLRYPHIGVVLIEDNCELVVALLYIEDIYNTIIGKNTYLDNQIHIAHNVKIGEIQLYSLSRYSWKFHNW